MQLTQRQIFCFSSAKTNSLLNNLLFFCFSPNRNITMNHHEIPSIHYQTICFLRFFALRFRKYHLYNVLPYRRLSAKNIHSTHSSIQFHLLTIFVVFNNKSPCSLLFGVHLLVVTFRISSVLVVFSCLHLLLILFLSQQTISKLTKVSLVIPPSSGI